MTVSMLRSQAHDEDSRMAMIEQRYADPKTVSMLRSQAHDEDSRMALIEQRYAEPKRTSFFEQRNAESDKPLRAVTPPTRVRGVATPSGGHRRPPSREGRVPACRPTSSEGPRQFRAGRDVTLLPNTSRDASRPASRDGSVQRLLEDSCLPRRARSASLRRLPEERKERAKGSPSKEDERSIITVREQDYHRYKNDLSALRSRQLARSVSRSRIKSTEPPEEPERKPVLAPLLPPRPIPKDDRSDFARVDSDMDRILNQYVYPETPPRSPDRDGDVSTASQRPPRPRSVGSLRSSPHRHGKGHRHRSKETCLSPKSREARQFQALVRQAKQKLQEHVDSGKALPSRTLVVPDEEKSPKVTLLRKPIRHQSIYGDACVWASIDPRNGSLHLYPRVVADRLEDSFFRRRAKVPLGGFGLGKWLEDAVVQFEYENGIRHVQRTAQGGVRDVLRVEVGLIDDVVELPHVQVLATDAGWRASEVNSDAEHGVDRRYFPPDWSCDAVAVAKLLQTLPRLRWQKPVAAA